MASLVRAKKAVRSQAKDLSVMAWVEDSYGQVLLVKQTAGKKLWTLPGGKVRRNESLLNALKREVKEETGLTVAIATPLDLFDRHQKGNITILFRVLLKKSAPTTRRRRSLEISASAYRLSLPSSATPSLNFFWKRAERSFEPLSVIRMGTEIA